MPSVDVGAWGVNRSDSSESVAVGTCSDLWSSRTRGLVLLGSLCLRVCRTVLHVHPESIVLRARCCSSCVRRRPCQGVVWCQFPCQFVVAYCQFLLLVGFRETSRSTRSRVLSWHTVWREFHVHERIDRGVVTKNVGCPPTTPPAERPPRARKLSSDVPRRPTSDRIPSQKGPGGILEPYLKLRVLVLINNVNYMN